MKQPGSQGTIEAYLTVLEDPRQYFVSRLKSVAKLLLHAARTHCEIENRPHWVLDFIFRKDDGRIHKGNGAENFSVPRHIGLNLLRREIAVKRSPKGKRMRAALDESYLLEVLTG